MFDPDAAVRHPDIARALGPVRAALACLATGERRILVACSGGPDSLVTLALLLLLRRSEGLKLHVAHIDHGLRRESAAEAEQVAELAAGLGLSFDLATPALAPGPGLAARAREARRAALLAFADRRRTAAIALGHTATDQCETMLMHLTRGAGLEGLAAMRVHESPWFRPLLELSRAQTRRLAERLELPFVDDPSNGDESQLRVWLRARVLPRLRDQNPRVEQAFVGLAEQAAEAESALSQWARREVEARRQVASAGGELRWRLADFAALPRAVRTRALRSMCGDGGVDLSRVPKRVIDALDEAAAAVARASAPATPSPAPRSWDLHPQRRLQIDKNGVQIALRRPPGPPVNH